MERPLRLLTWRLLMHRPTGTIEGAAAAGSTMTVRVDVDVRPFLIGSHVVDGIGRWCARVDADRVHWRAIDVCRDTEVEEAAALPNNRPRKRLGYRTPRAVFAEMTGLSPHSIPRSSTGLSRDI
jgi:hypothetical protein